MRKAKLSDDMGPTLFINDPSSLLCLKMKNITAAFGLILKGLNINLPENEYIDNYIKAIA